MQVRCAVPDLSQLDQKLKGHTQRVAARCDGNALKEIKEDGIQVPIGPVTRARSKRFKEELNTLIIKLQCDTKDISIKEELQEHKRPMIVHVIQALVDESI